MTKSINKAQNGYINISHNGDSVWVSPKDIVVDTKPLQEIFDNFNAKIVSLQCEREELLRELENVKKQFMEVKDQFEIARNEVAILRRTIEETIKELITR